VIPGAKRPPRVLPPPPPPLQKLPEQLAAETIAAAIRDSAKDLIDALVAWTVEVGQLLEGCSAQLNRWAANVQRAHDEDPAAFHGQRDPATNCPMCTDREGKRSE
jgi:hypothetical protein